MRANPYNHPALTKTIKVVVGFLILCKLMCSRWIYAAAVWLAYNAGERICGWILTCTIGAGWVYRDGGCYLYLTRFYLNPGVSAKNRLGLIMLAQRAIFGAMRYDDIKKFATHKRHHDARFPIVLEFQMNEYPSLDFGIVSCTINESDEVAFIYFPGTGDRQKFEHEYHIMMNVLDFPKGFVKPITAKIETGLILSEIEKIAEEPEEEPEKTHDEDPEEEPQEPQEPKIGERRWKIASKKQDDIGESSQDPEPTQPVSEIEDLHYRQAGRDPLDVS